MSDKCSGSPALQLRRLGGATGGDKNGIKLMRLWKLYKIRDNPRLDFNKMRKFYNKRQASLLLSWHKFYSWLNFSFCVRLPRSVKNQLSSQIFPQTEPRATYSRRRCRWACIWSSPRGPWCPPVRTRPWSTGWSRSCCGPGRAESPERRQGERCNTKGGKTSPTKLGNNFLEPWK